MGFVSDFIGGITGANKAGKAGQQAGQQQADAAQQGIDEQRRQFDAITKLMAPYVQSGTNALSQLNAITGQSGADAQKKAISGFEQSDIFKSLTQQGENSILQNASATGGLRGGNVQAALSQFRPEVLNSLIDQQYGRLSGLTQMGQNSASNQASLGMQSANNISNLFANRGAALAGGTIAAGNTRRQSFGDALNVAGLFF